MLGAMPVLSQLHNYVAASQLMAQAIALCPQCDCDPGQGPQGCRQPKLWQRDLPAGQWAPGQEGTQSGAGGEGAVSFVCALLLHLASKGVLPHWP